MTRFMSTRWMIVRWLVASALLLTGELSGQVPAAEPAVQEGGGGRGGNLPPSPIGGADIAPLPPLTTAPAGGRGGDAQPASMAEQRAQQNAGLQPRVEAMRALYPVDVEETTIGGVSVAVVTPQGGVPERNRNRVMLNVPGGGFRTGIRANGLFISIPVASLGQMKVITAVYRQSPEFQYPAASDDLLAVYRAVLTDHPGANIGLFGCSAGATIVAETIAAIIREGLPTPGVAGLYCGGASARFDGDSSSYSALASASSLPVEFGGPSAAIYGPDGYFGNVDVDTPDVSPVVSLDLLRQFPPTILATGTRDFAMSMAAFTHRRLIAAGVDTQLLIYDGMGHGFMTRPDTPQARDLYELTVRFYDTHLGR